MTKLATLGLATTLLGCTTTNPGVEGTQSLRVTVVDPVETGDVDDRLDDSHRVVTFSVEALDEQGELDTGFSRTVDVYAQFLGSLTGDVSDNPLATFEVVDGESGEFTLELPPVFGPTHIWVEDGDRGPAQAGASTYATGTSSALWFRDPFVEDLQRPLDEAALAALEQSPLIDKQAGVRGSRYGERGRLIVTSIYAQGYTVSDVECQDAAGTPPCVSGDYDHMLVFSFSRPRDDEGNPLAVGQSISGFAGGVTDFNGLTEMSFPQTFVDGALEVDEARIPAPVLADESWFDDIIQFERVESGLIEFRDVTVCPLDEEFTEFNQWKLDLGRGCDDNETSISVITAGTVTDFVPGDHVGEVLPSVVGTLRPVNLPGFNVWIIFPRSSADLVLP
jgi:hypothetical protein